MMWCCCCSSSSSSSDVEPTTGKECKQRILRRQRTTDVTVREGGYKRGQFKNGGNSSQFGKAVFEKIEFDEGSNMTISDFFSSELELENGFCARCFYIFSSSSSAVSLNFYGL